MAIRHLHSARNAEPQHPHQRETPKITLRHNLKRLKTRPRAHQHGALGPSRARPAPAPHGPAAAEPEHQPAARTPRGAARPDHRPTAAGRRGAAASTALCEEGTWERQKTGATKSFTPPLPPAPAPSLEQISACPSAPRAPGVGYVKTHPAHGRGSRAPLTRPRSGGEGGGAGSRQPPRRYLRENKK